MSGRLASSPNLSYNYNRFMADPLATNITANLITITRSPAEKSVISPQSLFGSWSNVQVRCNISQEM